MNYAKGPVKIHLLEAEKKTFDPWSTKRVASLVSPNNHKTLKIPVFGGLWVYLVIFEFVVMTPKENLVLFDFTNSHLKSIWIYLDLVFLKGKNTNKLFLKI